MHTWLFDKKNTECKQDFCLLTRNLLRAVYHIICNFLKHSSSRAQSCSNWPDAGMCEYSAILGVELSETTWKSVLKCAPLFPLERIIGNYKDTYSKRHRAVEDWTGTEMQPGGRYETRLQVWPFKTGTNTLSLRHGRTTWCRSYIVWSTLNP